ncbi:PLP-dependent transferase [Schaalia sp. ZJ405]|uniref:PLP-dependent transferase n=1 Tax=Schaalia sp. ZJ405 TaxID=2709403 RepID=UPI0013EE1139|nr:PLP-dependent transferase [Schaalia sp. ZJ405]QPK81503.1 PLP-dependent transferase [Schaalia sp. ZJ405]
MSTTTDSSNRCFSDESACTGHPHSATQVWGTREFAFETRAIHEGFAPDPLTGDVVPPLHVSSTHVQNAPGDLKEGFEYGRCGNPTTNAFASALARLEGATHGFVFPSGMSAEDTVVRLLTRPGSHIVHSTDVYGGTHKLFSVVKPAEGWTSTSVDLSQGDAARKRLESERPDLVWVESPSNPFLTVTDIRSIAEVTHRIGALLVVDSTFATPYLQRPLELGADVVVHSTTKYIGGHSDIVGGAVILRNGLEIPSSITPLFGSRDAAEELRCLQMAIGAVQSPRDAHLAHRGLKTLGLRVARHCDNALAVAQFLSAHPRVAAVHYPGLSTDPGYDVASRQMPRGCGGVVSLQLRSEAEALALCTSTHVLTLAASLGAVESLIEHPAIMTHSTRAGGGGGVPGTLVRLAVGLEDPSDLIADLDHALNSLPA